MRDQRSDYLSIISSFIVQLFAFLQFFSAFLLFASIIKVRKRYLNLLMIIISIEIFNVMNSNLLKSWKINDDKTNVHERYNFANFVVYLVRNSSLDINKYFHDLFFFKQWWDRLWSYYKIFVFWIFQVIYD